MSLQILLKNAFNEKASEKKISSRSRLHGSLTSEPLEGNHVVFESSIREEGGHKNIAEVLKDIYDLLFPKKIEPFL